MIYSNVLVALAFSAGLIDVAVGNTIGERTLVARQNASATCLNPKSIATASANDGQQSGDQGIAAGQAPSET